MFAPMRQRSRPSTADLFARPVRTHAENEAKICLARSTALGRARASQCFLRKHFDQRRARETKEGKPSVSFASRVVRPSGRVQGCGKASLVLQARLGLPVQNYSSFSCI